MRLQRKHLLPRRAEVARPTDWRRPPSLVVEPTPGGLEPHRPALAALFDAHNLAADEIRRLQSSGFDLQKLSIVARDFQAEDHPLRWANEIDRVKAWRRRGAFWAGMWGRLHGSAHFTVPGVGELLAAGPIVGWIGAALQGALVVRGGSALVAGLHGLGVSPENLFDCEAGVKAGGYVVIRSRP